MHGRITRFNIKAEFIEEVTSRIPQIRTMTSAIPGGVFNYVFWNDDGSGVAVAIYENIQASDAANAQISEIWGGLAPMLSAPPTIEAYANVESMRN